MPDDRTDLERFRTDGYVILERAVDRAALDELIAALAQEHQAEMLAALSGDNN